MTAIFIIATLVINFVLLAFPPAALAHCPLCVAGAGAGLTLSRYLGVDDTVTGIWMAAFLGAMAFWLETYLFKRIKDQNLKLLLRPVIYIAVFASTLWSFYQFKLVVTMFKIFGVDKLTFGIISGGILFYLVDVVDNLVIKSAGRVFIPYQRVIVSLGSVMALSLVVFFLVTYVI